MSRRLCYYIASNKLISCYLTTPLQKQALRFINTAEGQERGRTGGRWRRLWQSWVPIPTTVGVTVLAVIQWRRLQRRSQDPSSPPAEAKDWEITCYRAVPCRALSRAWGWLSDCQLPRPVRVLVYKTYSSMYGVDLDEMAGDLQDYPSLARFFTRPLKPGTRPVDHTHCLVSPADGKLLNYGRISSPSVEQIKGVTYKVQTFLGEPTWTLSAPFRELDENSNEVASKATSDEVSVLGGVDLLRLLVRGRDKAVTKVSSWEQYKLRLLRNPSQNELYQAVVYLAPGDYHRFHSPADWNVTFRRHFQGELLSVSPGIAGWIPELFSLNERVVYTGQWQHGFFSMTAVGATNVGSIRVYCDNELQTNTRKWRDGTRHRDRRMDAQWRKGEEVGEFRMGSTIVLIFEAPRDFAFNSSPAQSVKVGQSLGCAR